MAKGLPFPPARGGGKKMQGPTHGPLRGSSADGEMRRASNKHSGAREGGREGA